VQTAVDTKNHIIVAHEVTNVGTDRHQLSNMAEQARTEMGVETLDAVTDRGYYASEETGAVRMTNTATPTTNTPTIVSVAKKRLISSRSNRMARGSSR
jgi:hypothetical protein